MAKRTSRKQTKSRSTRTRTTGRKRTAAKRSVKRAKRSTSRTRHAARRTAARGTKTKTARRKNAARATASRTTRAETKPPEPSRLASATAAVKGVMAGAVAAVSKRMPGTTDVDAITLLETDHRRLQDLLKQGEETTDRATTTRRQLLDTITAELGVHELIEEKLLYPALKKYPEARDIVLEGFQEHHVADVIVKELHGVATSDEQWGAKFKVLKENIEHHIEEEEGPMFRTARGVMSSEELQALGARMAKMKREAEARR